jgi:hypothetical protein
LPSGLFIYDLVELVDVDNQSSNLTPQPYPLEVILSFGYAIEDFILLSQLSFRTVQNARRAYGAHDELAREARGISETDLEEEIVKLVVNRYSYPEGGQLAS